MIAAEEWLPVRSRRGQGSCHWGGGWGKCGVITLQIQTIILIWSQIRTCGFSAEPGAGTKGQGFHSLLLFLPFHLPLGLYLLPTLNPAPAMALFLLHNGADSRHSHPRPHSFWSLLEFSYMLLPLSLWLEGQGETVQQLVSMAVDFSGASGLL